MRIAVCLFILSQLVGGAAWQGGGPINNLTLSGITLQKNGSAWAPVGVTIVGFVAPRAVIGFPYNQGAAFYNATELNAIRNTLHGDTLRFQVSQPGLDPQSSIYDQNYAYQLASVFAVARANNFVVIVSMQAEAPSGLQGLPCMPNAQTSRSWQTILPFVANVPGIMLEIFNEPCDGESSQSTSPADQAAWQSSMNAVIATIRNYGAKNILILDGLWFGQNTNSLGPLVSDPQNLWVFGVHPYANVNLENSTQWASAFGANAATYPTIISEWNATPANGCVASQPTVAANEVNYFIATGGAKGLGVIGWAADYPQTVFQDNISYVPTNYSSWTSCGDGSISGAGSLIAAY